MLLERVLALPPRDIVAEALVRLHGAHWRVASVSEHHVELLRARSGPDWPFVVVPIVALLGHLVLFFAAAPPEDAAVGDRIIRYMILVWPAVIAGLTSYHFLRRSPATITVTALPTAEGTRLVARAEGSAAAQEDLEYFLDHVVGVARRRLLDSEPDGG